MIELLDYTVTTSLYVICAFLFALSIDGYLLPPFKESEEKKKTTVKLFFFSSLRQNFRNDDIFV
jgi:hypothetical protein